MVVYVVLCSLAKDQSKEQKTRKFMTNAKVTSKITHEGIRFRRFAPPSEEASSGSAGREQ